MRATRQDKPKSVPPAAPPIDRAARLDSLLLASVTALLVATPLIPSESTVTFGTAAPLNLLWVLLLIAWALASWLRPNPQFKFGWTGIAAAALIGWHTLAALTAGLDGNGRQALNMLWQWISYGLAALLLRQLLASAAECRALMVVMIALAAAESSHASYEYFISKPAQIADFRQNEEGKFRQAGVTSEIEKQQFRWRLEAVEPLGTFALTNSLAGLVAPWLIALLGIGLAALARFDFHRTMAAAVEMMRHNLGQLLFAVFVLCLRLSLAGLLSACLLFTKSRTAVLATGVGLLLLTLYGHPGGWRIGWKTPAIGAAVLVLLGLAIVAVGGLDFEVLSEAPLSVRYRLEYWRATAAMIADHPLLGCGPGNFQEHYARYKLPQSSETVGDPHNFLLEIWATAGTPALLAALAMAATFAWQVSQGKPSESLPEKSGGRSISIYGGALVGILLAYPLGLIVGYPPPEMSPSLPLPVIWCIGLPVAAASVWLLDGWVRRGEMPVALPVIALVVLLVNLLAAGSTSFPGVFLSVWLLMPVTLVQANAPTWNWPLTKTLQLVLLGVGMAILFACVQTQVSPVLTATPKQLLARDALQTGNLDQAEQELLAAAQADPWSPEPWRILADLRIQIYAQTGRDEDFNRFAAAAAEFRRRDPHHDRQFEARGNWLLLAWRKSGRPEHLDAALAAYRGAALSHPGRAMHQAQLAWTLHLAGKSKEAAAAADEALRLDALNPHGEQKLIQQRIYDPQIGPTAIAPYRPEDAEQTLHHLRTTNGPEKSP